MLLPTMDDGGLSGLGEYGVHSEFLERSSGKALLAAMPPDCTIPINRTHAVLAVFLILGTLVAYSPQLLKIYRSRSSDGFSPWYLMLGALSCTSGFLNIIILQSPIMRCCTAVPFGQCLYNILGFLQTAAQAAMFFSLLALFYVYFPDGKKTISSAEDEGRISKDWRNSLYSLKVIFTFMVFTSVISATIIVQFGVPSRAATAWTAALALVSIIGSIIQFIPQIMRTWRHKVAPAFQARPCLSLHLLAVVNFLSNAY